jgi:aldose 1-epimerase
MTINRTMRPDYCGERKNLGGGMHAWHLRVPVSNSRGIQGGIREVKVLEGGLNIYSEVGMIHGKPQELLKTKPENEIVDYLQQGPNNYFTLFNAVLCPWANRIDGLKEGKFLRASWLGMTRLLPMNFPKEGTSIHGLIHARVHKDVECFKTDEGIALTGYTEISGTEWFSPLSIIHHIELLETGKLRRSVMAYNIGNDSSPVGIGEHPYIMIPEGQKRNRVILDIPAQSVVRTDDRLLPLLKEEEVFADMGSPYFQKQSPFFLGKLSLDHCFARLHKPVTVKLGFPNLGWGFKIEGENSINAIQVYAPTDPKADAFGSVAIELQGNYADPLDPAWEQHSEFGPFGYTASGMKDLRSRSGMALDKDRQTEWQVTHSLYTMKDGSKKISR